LKGFENLENLVLTRPIGRTRQQSRTYTVMFNAIRDLFSRLPAALVRGTTRAG